MMLISNECIPANGTLNCEGAQHSARYGQCRVGAGNDSDSTGQHCTSTVFEFLATHLRLLEVPWFYACFCADSIPIGTFARMPSTGWGTPTCMSGSESSFELHELPGSSEESLVAS